MGDTLQRIVVLSDLHFGDENAQLVRGELVGRLFAELGETGDIDVLVLLGDVWDLWSTGFGAAAAAGAPFFRALTAWGAPRECILVAGNHDYHLWTACEDRQVRRAQGWEEVERLSVSLAADFASEDRVCLVQDLPLWMHYPFLSLEVDGRSLLLMHGHQLDYFSRSFWWAKTAWLARAILGRSHYIALSDIDRLNKPFFELLTQTARVPELRAWEYRFYAVLRFFARLLRFQSKSGGSPRRLTSVEQNEGEAIALLRDLMPGYIPDLFVFGHTHRAGFSRVRVGERQVLLANSGCWVEGSGDETDMTYLVIDEAVRLRRLGGEEITVDWRALTPRSGARPPS
jgi:UDP-2,3-diacylglucosamine pyrophosphatase LpxH